MLRSLSLVLVAVGVLAAQAVLARADDLPTAAESSAAPAPAPRRDWVRTGQSRYNWNWLAERYDKDSDGIVSASEIPLSNEIFARLDRTWDGKLTAADFDWSQEGALCRQKETTFALFKSVDANSDGRIGTEEWQALFAKVAQDEGYLNEEELERLIYLPRVLKTAAEQKLRTGRTQFSPERMAARTQSPRPGEMAPDFDLRTPGGEKSIKLSSYRGKSPVVLVFGCYSCGNYRTYSESMEELYKLWNKDAVFLRVYVREAHPVADDQPATPTNALAGILIKQPASFEERCTVAAKFASELNIKTPVVVDEIDNRVGQAYGGWPDRLYLIDQDGKIAFTGGPGPFGFNPRELEQSLAMLLLDQPQESR